MGLDLTVTHRKLSLSSPRDSTTGWYPKEFNESTIKMYIESKGAFKTNLPAGVYVRTDFVGMCAAPVWEGDEIKDASNKYFEVEAIQKEVTIADSFVYRAVDLVYLPFHGKTYPTTTPTVQDARFNTKDYWDDYLDNDNLQTSQWIVCYSDPPYPLTRVFNDKSIDLIFTVDYPKSKAREDATGIYGYMEDVTTHVWCLDTKLGWLGEHDLRRVVEEYPGGSRRDLDTLTPVVHELGSTKLYDIPVVMNYWRRIT